MRVDSRFLSQLTACHVSWICRRSVCWSRNTSKTDRVDTSASHQVVALTCVVRTDDEHGDRMFKLFRLGVDGSAECGHAMSEAQ